MPARLNAKGPGEFIRDHLIEPQIGGRDYVGSMYQAYKDHLRSAGVRRLPCRPTFHKYVWLLKETGALVFDGAQAISFGAEPPEDLPADYQPACGMPAPRHYYCIVDPQQAAFLKPEAIWRAQRGLAAAVAAPGPLWLLRAQSPQLRRGLLRQLHRPDPDAATPWPTGWRTRPRLSSPGSRASVHTGHAVQISLKVQVGCIVLPRHRSWGQKRLGNSYTSNLSRRGWGQGKAFNREQAGSRPHARDATGSSFTGRARRFFEKTRGFLRARQKDKLLYPDAMLRISPGSRDAPAAVGWRR